MWGGTQEGAFLDAAVATLCSWSAPVSSGEQCGQMCVCGCRRFPGPGGSRCGQRDRKLKEVCV